MALLSLKNVSRSFGSTKAVSDVSLDVAQGEFFGLLGPSGCGKTTTLRMIAGLMSDRVASALELVQLPGYGKRAVDQLSGGQQQRVAIARAIAIEPALLLFDEPLSNLDVSLREETRSELRELVTRLGLTAVYVTHDQEEAFALCDRISVMVGGKLMQTGRPRELYEEPAEISVATFLGRNNLIKAMRLSSSKNSDGEFKTLEGGHTLHLTVKHDELAPLNKPVFLAIRPEHVQLSSNSAENSLRGNIREIVFAGATSTVRVDAGGLLLEALVLRTDGLSVDQECNVVLPKNQLTLLKNGHG
jgi:ABC-type Fe3+/spermidine/putrescine transport system ATPase subunit